MANKKPSSRQVNIREFRSQVAKLKAKGLVSAKVDARSQAPTRYMQNQIKKFAAVLEGRAQVVKAPSTKEARQYKEGGRYLTKGKAIIIPTNDKTERLRYNKKRHVVESTSDARGKHHTKEYSPKPVTDPAALPKGSEIRYTVPLGRSYRSFDTFEDLERFMMPYERDSKKPYKDWQTYVIIERHGTRSRRVSQRAA